MSALAILGFAVLPLQAAAPPPERSSLVLITLDTTRDDAVGRAEGGSARTPNLDTLARGGTRYANAVSPAPLTLPAHCSLMTGLDPPAHGVRDNGVGGLPADVTTLAAVLSKRGYTTAAFVSSRVLDRRFGLDRGFATYDDRMVAENVGEQGYPERDARAVTDAALAWARSVPKGRPFFLWIHYYDPHAPYRPPGDWSGRSAAERYAGEVAFVDSQIGRLLAGLPEPPGGRLIAAVGDHGEMLGEHGEKEHGILLYRGSLAVPLILSGPRVAPGAVVRELVGIRGLPSTLLALLGFPEDAAPFGPALPHSANPERKGPPAVYSETLLPATAYGWNTLRSATGARWKYIEAPRPELYDLLADPGESRNLAAERPEEAALLRRLLDAQPARAQGSPAPSADPELAASLRSLGYLGGSSPAPKMGSGLDPKDGIGMLDEFEQAKQLAREGRNADAAARLESLVRRSPGNVPFLLRLGDAQLALGRTAEGVRSLTRAVQLSPRLDFLHVRLAQAYAELGRLEEAKREYRATLELNPRSAPAWSGLAEIARRTEGPAAERRVLEDCEAAGTLSASLLRRLAELERGMGDAALAQRHAAEAEARAASPQ